MRLIPYFCIVTLICVLLASCAHTPGKVRIVSNPLVAAECPKLSETAPDTFGDTVKLLIDTSTQYNKCRTAALAIPSP